MAQSPIFVVDAFVGNRRERTLRGNPAAVVLLAENREDAWMQRIAAEMNLSETAFVIRRDEQNFDLRWFTPRLEVQLCGHATLAAAHVLWQSELLNPSKTAIFHTLSGALPAHKQGEWIELDFPAQPVQIVAASHELSWALGIKPHEPVAFMRAKDDWLLKVPVGLVKELQPNFPHLREISAKLGLRGVIVTSLAPPDSEFDFVSRFFAPAVGVDEDPVTGSAHTKLAPFWGKRFDKKEMLGFQASQRGGLVRVSWRGERVSLARKAITALRGELLL